MSRDSVGLSELEGRASSHHLTRAERLVGWRGELRESLPRRTIGGHSLGVAELRPPSSPSLILLRFPPKLFPIDGIRREDYRIVGEHRDGSFAKSFFGG